MMQSDIVSENFREAPYWWDDAPLPTLLYQDVPKTSNVAFIGGGTTSLVAALVLLQNGRSVTIFDANSPGWGASRRNFGTLGRTLKKSFSHLTHKYGLPYAKRVYTEVGLALDEIKNLIAELRLDCSHVVSGRFIGATSRSHYDRLARELELLKNHVGFDFYMVSRSEQHREIGTDIYFGGAIVPDLGALHPGKYHEGLLNAVIKRGGVIVGDTAVTNIVPAEGKGNITVNTARGSLTADAAVLATNGYTPRWLDWHARRLIPFTGYVAATEPLSIDLIHQALPTRRTLVDSNTDTDYVRISPDQTRLLFGGLTGSSPPTLLAMVPRLREILLRLFPFLESVRTSHVWSGQCAATFDYMPHIGVNNNIWYALGYNFAGLPMGAYLAKKLAYQMLARPEGTTVFSEREFPTVPFYFGNPWFVPYAMRYFNFRDDNLRDRDPSWIDKVATRYLGPT